MSKKRKKRNGHQVRAAALRALRAKIDSVSDPTIKTVLKRLYLENRRLAGQIRGLMAHIERVKQDVRVVDEYVFPIGGREF